MRFGKYVLNMLCYSLLSLRKFVLHNIKNKVNPLPPPSHTQVSGIFKYIYRMEAMYNKDIGINLVLKK